MSILYLQPYKVSSTNQLIHCHFPISVFPSNKVGTFSDLCNSTILHIPFPLFKTRERYNYFIYHCLTDHSFPTSTCPLDTEIPQNTIFYKAKSPSHNLPGGICSARILWHYPNSSDQSPGKGLLIRSQFEKYSIISNPKSLRTILYVNIFKITHSHAMLITSLAPLYLK